MAKTIGRFAPSEVPALPRDFGNFIARQTGYSDRLGIIPSEISPTELDSIRSAAASGDLTRLYELYEKMLVSDSRIGGISGSMKATVSGLPLKTMRAPTTSAREVALAEDYRNTCIEAYNNIDTHAFVGDLVNAYEIGCVPFQMKYKIHDYPRGQKLALPEQPRRIPGQSLKMNMLTNDPNWGELYMITMEKPTGIYFKEIDKRKAFLVEDGTGLRGRYDTLGALRRVLGWWITKMYAQLWWIEYVEGYGQPTRVGRYAPEATSSDRAELKSFLDTIGRNKWGMFPQGADIQLLESTNSGNITTFSDLIKVANDEIATAMTGQSGMNKDAAQGSRAQLQVLNGVRLEIVAHIAEVVRKGFDAFNHAVLAVNYGDDYVKRLIPLTKPIVAKPGDNSEKVRIFTDLSNAGVPVAVDEIHDQLGIPHAEEGQMVLFHGKLVPMTNIQKMNDERENSLDDEQQSAAGREEAENGDDGSENGGDKDQGKDSERTVPPTEK